MARRGLFCGLPLVVAALMLGAASLHGARASAGDYTIAVDGPSSITIDPCCVPAKFPFTVTVSYVGPALDPPPAEAQTRMTVHLSEFTHSLESQFSDGGNGVSDCQTEYGPTGYWGPEWTDFSCTLHFTQGHLSTTMSGLVRPSGEGGTATTTAILSTGESASFTTDFNRLAEPPPPPAAIPGPAAAPTKTVTETFTQAGEAEPESTSISPSAETAQIALSWPESKSSFDVTGITLVAPSGRVVAQAERRPLRLKIKKIRGRHSLDVRIKHLRRGRLRFKIVATKLAKATRVLAKIRQSKR